ncbi:MAG: helix-turn-helix domain-containing protein [Saccharospirillum sp.]
MFFNETDQVSVWVTINSAGFALLLVGWTVLSLIYLGKIVMDTRAYHQKLNTEFADHSGKRLDWLVGFTGLMVVTWIYALVVLGASSDTSTRLISETALSFLVLLLIWVFCLQTVGRRPAFSHIEPVSKPELATESRSEGSFERKYSNSSIDGERLKRIANKVEQKVMGDKTYLNPDIDASTLASELGISVHYLSQAFSQEMKTTFYGYINDARIEAAKAALKTSQQSVLEIAFSVGYNTRSSFYNAFKKRTGMTPSQYKTSVTSVAPIA